MNRLWLLCLFFVLSCSSPSPEGPPTNSTPSPAAKPTFVASDHPDVKLTVIGPKGTSHEVSLETLSKGDLKTLVYEDHMYGESRTYIGVDLEGLLALSPDKGEVEILKFHARDGFVSEVARSTVKKGTFLLAFRDEAAAPRTFLPTEEIRFLNEEPSRIAAMLEDKSLDASKREELERERDHLNTLLNDLTALKDQGPFFPIFMGENLGPDEKWNPPFCVDKVTLASAPTDRTAAMPEGLDKDHPAMRGAKFFEKRCAICHAINGIGGQVGPELNRPMSITAYWDEEALRKLLYDPKQVRENSKMPALRLKEPIIDDLLAYLKWMDQHR